MRYYEITTGNGFSWTTLGQGGTNPNALNIELDLSVSIGSVPSSTPASFCRIWGIDISTISQANNFNKQSIQIKGGMANGLPLATAQAPHAGLLVTGQIFPCMGNWKGTDMTLDFIITFGGVRGSQSNPLQPANISFNLQPNQPMSEAIQSALQTAFPNMKLNINISPNLKRAYQEVGYNGDINGFEQYLNQTSRSILGFQNYNGITVSTDGTTLRVTDGTAPSGNTVTLNYIDLVGQPSWIELNTLTATLIMRSDIFPGDTVIFPQTPILTNSDRQALSAQSGFLTFQGAVQVSSVRHVGNFRNPSGDAWVTVITGIFLGASSGIPGAPSPTTVAATVFNNLNSGALSSITSALGRAVRFF